MQFGLKKLKRKIKNNRDKRLREFKVDGDPKKIKHEEKKFNTKIAIIDGVERARKTTRSLLRRPLNRKQKKVLALTIIGIILFIALGIALSKPLMSFLSDPSVFKRWFEEEPVTAAFAFVAIMVVQIIIAVIPGEPLQLAAGYGFGIFGGTLLCVIGAIIGSSIVFLLVKKFGVKLLYVFFSKEDLQAISFFQDSHRRNTLAFILMFIPGTPKDLFTYVIPLTPMKLSTWLLISIPARLLGIVGSTVMGSQFASNNYLVVAVIAVIATMMTILGLLYYRKLAKENPLS